MASRSWKKRVKGGPGGSGRVLEQPWALAKSQRMALQAQKPGFPESWIGFPQLILSKVIRNWLYKLITLHWDNPYHSFDETLSPNFRITTRTNKARYS